MYPSHGDIKLLLVDFNVLRLQWNVVRQEILLKVFINAKYNKLEGGKQIFIDFNHVL